jgi:uncharacterized protein
LGENLKILALADLHDRSCQLSELKDAQADLVVVCGDLHNGGPADVTKSTVDALAGLGHPVLIVPGNTDPRPLAEVLWNDAGFINLDRRAYCYTSPGHSVGFIGFGGMVPGNPKRIGDPGRYYHSDEEVYKVLAECYREIAGCDWRVVVTHQPPRGALGKIYNGEITGCASLVRFIEDYQPDLLICGHIHEARGVAEMGNTKVINVGDLARGYSAMIELDDGLDIVLNQV